ncbi:MAG: hypothetical protein IJI73_09260 [Kiritimatiellae bacterium]|nr:hypothetical protein [Kiritimatiellia bacterium]
MKAQLKQTAIHMLTPALLFVAAYLFAGCSATKIKFEKTSDGTTKYSIWHNDHWLKTEAESLTGGMSDDGKFEFSAEGLKSSPSEEFNRTMQTYTAAVVSMMQIAAAAYNPSSSKVVSGGVESGGVNSPTPSLTQSPTSSTGEAAAKEVKSGSDSVGTGSVESSTGNNAASDPHAAECTDGSCTTGECTDGSCNP